MQDVLNLMKASIQKGTNMSLGVLRYYGLIQVHINRQLIIFLPYVNTTKQSFS